MTDKPRTSASPKVRPADWRAWLTSGERAEVAAIDARHAQDTARRQLLMNRAKQRRHRHTMPNATGD